MSGGMLGDLDGTTDAICSYVKVSRWERARACPESPEGVRVILHISPTVNLSKGKGISGVTLVFPRQDGWDS